MNKTDQEKLWAGDFGNRYIERCSTGDAAQAIARNAAFFAQALARTRDVRDILEIGANVGYNLVALHGLLPEAALSAVEINSQAVERLKALPFLAQVHPGSILDLDLESSHDLVFTKEVLIHINPDALPGVYAKMHKASRRYVLVAEYYSPNPVEVEYRGESGALFKRDFAGEMLDAHPDLRLLDYGFVYRRDPNFPQDDLNWFLLEKKG